MLCSAIFTPRVRGRQSRCRRRVVFHTLPACFSALYRMPRKCTKYGSISYQIYHFCHCIHCLGILYNASFYTLPVTLHFHFFFHSSPLYLFQLISPLSLPTSHPTWQFVFQGHMASNQLAIHAGKCSRKTEQQGQRRVRRYLIPHETSCLYTYPRILLQA